LGWPGAGLLGGRARSSVGSVDFAAVATDALRLALALALPALVASFTLGLLLALFELLTQAQDATLAFVPRLIAVAVTLFLGREFMASELVHFTADLFGRITQLAR
jgi:flagellar biosynthetic protein FliQ